MTPVEALAHRPDLLATCVNIPRTTEPVLRPYQHAAHDAIWRVMHAGKRRVLLVAPTGSGKTTTFGYLISRSKSRVLVLVDRDGLANQTQERMRSEWGIFSQREQGRERAELSQRIPWLDNQHKVVVATRQTLGRPKRLERFPPDYFRLIVVDEADLATSPQYRRIFAYFKDAYVLGVTATPDTNGGIALSSVFEEVAFDYSLLDAVNDGWLVEPRTFVVPTMIDFSGLHTRGGDFVEKEIGDTMRAHRAVIEVAHGAVQHCRGMSTLIFAVNRHHAQLLVDALNGIRKGSARYLDGETPREERDALYKGLWEREFQYLVNIAVCSRGWDCPPLECVVNAAPTKSQRAYCQRIGRVLRPLPGIVDGHHSAQARIAAIKASAKPYGFVLDFTGIEGTHSLICATDLLAGKDPDEVKAKARKIVKEKEANVQEALFDARLWWEEEQKRLAEAARIAKVHSEKRRVDLLGPLRLREDKPRLSWGRENKPASEKQKAVLDRVGVKYQASELTLAEASRLIDALPATNAQRGLLYRRGIPAPANLSFRQASALLDAHKEKQ